MPIAITEPRRITRRSQLRALVLVGGFCPLGQITDGEEASFLELTAPQRTYFVQEPIRLHLRFGLETRFRASQMLQLFRQQLDVPVQLQASWLAELPGATPVVMDDLRAGRRASFVLGDEVEQALEIGNRTRPGGEFSVFDVELVFLPTRAGDLVFSAPSLRFAFATDFRRDFAGERVASDRHDGLVTGDPLTLRVLPLPEEGRPPEFTGAVGRFSVLADVDSRRVTLGGSLKLTLAVEGVGNLSVFDPPRLDRLEGFKVYGMLDSKSTTRRTFTYDLAPRSARVDAVPAISFAFFDPGPPPAYRVALTAPIPILVRPGAVGADGAPLLGQDESLAKAPTTEPPDADSWRGKFLAIVLLFPWLLVIGLLSWVIARVRGRVSGPPVDTRAHAAFLAGLETRGLDAAGPLTEYLAARLQCSEAAVIGPDLPQRLETAGISAPLAQRAATLLEDLVAARFGGAPPSAGTQDARDLVDDLERAFQA